MCSQGGLSLSRALLNCTLLHSYHFSKIRGIIIILAFYRWRREIKGLIQGNANQVRAPALGSLVLAPALTMKHPLLKTSSPDFNAIYVSLVLSRIWAKHDIQYSKQRVLY